MTTSQSTHRHEFYLTHTHVGRETGRRFYVGTCACGKTESVRT